MNQEIQDQELARVQEEIAREEESLQEIQEYYRTFAEEHDDVSVGLKEIAPDMNELQEQYVRALRLRAKGVVNARQFENIKARVSQVGAAAEKMIGILNSVGSKGLKLLEEEQTLIKSIQHKKTLVKALTNFDNEADESRPFIC